ncbi:MAG TPA: carboxypeptidase-like regulatory domain-containing protein, partial [Acidobacteriaceae bacterium]|nr:carboxypeptidase-like regulatory domain-containing protein [Acidobacteriaceae bacterium]
MKHAVTTLAVILLLLGSASTRAWAAPDAMVSGVVRDAHGTPQLGALVELLGPDAAVVARAFTDDHGRYLLSAALPGSYQLRVSAAFLIPAVRANLRLRSGVKSVADLTMTAIFEAGAWLPTEGRRSNADSDDWRWTL